MVGALLEVGVWKNGRSLWSEAYFQIKKYRAHHARSTFGRWGVEKWQVTVVRSIFSNRLGALLEVGVSKNGRSLWREAYFQIKRYKAHHARTTLGSWGVEKWQVTVAQSAFSNQETQTTQCAEHFWKLGRGNMAGHCGAKRIFKSRNTEHTMLGALLEDGVWKTGRSLWCEAYFQIDSEHFWKLGRGKMAGHCGAKRIFKSRNTKHTMLGALLEVGVWKNGGSLWREAYFQIKKYKAHHARSTFGSWGVEKWQITAERSIFANQEIQNTPCLEHFWKFRCQKSANGCAKHICKSKCKKNRFRITFEGIDIEKR